MNAVKAIIERAVLVLAGRCDGADTRDGAGFNRYDAALGRDLAERIEAGRSVNLALAYKVVSKYRRQLEAAGIELPTLDAAREAQDEVRAERKAQMPNGVEMVRVGGRVHIRFPYDPKLVDVARGLPGRRWEPATKAWTVPATALDDALKAFPRAILADDMGCIDGDAIINVNRAGKGFKVRLVDAYERFRGIAGRHNWRADIPTYCRALCDGELRQHRILNIVDRGLRHVVRLTLASGKSLRMTNDHEVAMADGSWCPASQLRAGASVLTNGRRMFGESNPNWKGGRCVDQDGYVRVQAWGHPRANAAGQVYEHIMVMEAHLGRPVDWPEQVHHVNGNRADNRIENLALVTPSEHHRAHRKHRNLEGRRVRFVPDQ